MQKRKSGGIIRRIWYNGVVVANNWRFSMFFAELESKLKSLPQAALEEVASYVDYVSFKFNASKTQKSSVSKKKGFGCLKDIPCKMSPDFDEPLEEFAEYM